MSSVRKLKGCWLRHVHQQPFRLSFSAGLSPFTGEQPDEEEKLEAVPTGFYESGLTGNIPISRGTAIKIVLQITHRSSLNEHCP